MNLADGVCALQRGPAGNLGMRKQLAVGFALALGLMSIAWAQHYSSRAITVVVPFGAGGPHAT
jgi:hypothetical protein